MSWGLWSAGKHRQRLADVRKTRCGADLNAQHSLQCHVSKFVGRAMASNGYMWKPNCGSLDIYWGHERVLGDLQWNQSTRTVTFSDCLDETWRTLPRMGLLMVNNCWLSRIVNGFPVGSCWVLVCFMCPAVCHEECWLFTVHHSSTFNIHLMFIKFHKHPPTFINLPQPINGWICSW